MTEKLSKPIVRPIERVIMTRQMVGHLRKEIDDEPIREVMMFWNEKTLDYIGCIDPYKDDIEKNQN